MHRSASGSMEELSVQVTILGGDTLVWLGGTNATDFVPLQKKWAGTFTEDKLFPISMRLVGIWAVIKEFDGAKAAAVEAFIKQKWDAETKALLALDSLPAKQQTLQWKMVAQAVSCDDGCAKFDGSCSQQ